MKKQLLMITLLVSAVSIQAEHLDKDMKDLQNESTVSNWIDTTGLIWMGGTRSSIPLDSRPKHDLLQALGGAIKALPSKKGKMSIEAENDLDEAKTLARDSHLKKEYLKGAVGKAISQLNKVAKMRKSGSDSRAKLTESIENLKEALRNL